MVIYQEMYNEVAWTITDCHVLQDFDAVTLKTKKHWQSFTCDEYFRSVDSVIADIKSHGRLTIDKAACQAVMNQPMMCPRCKVILKNMPDVKLHVKSRQHQERD